MKSVIFKGAIFALVSLFTAMLISAGQNAPAQQKAKAVFEDSCSGCHGADLATSARYSREEWAGVVQRMVEKGLPLEKADVDLIVDYLASNYGLEPQKAPAAPSRPADNHPDLSGIWQAIGAAHWNLEDHPPSAGPFYQLGAIGATPGGLGVVEGGTIPYKPEALAKKKENAANRYALDPEVKCYMPGIPRATYMPYPFQIVQTSTYILMAYEYATSDRVINMGKPVEAPVDTWMGTANGKWEGDTLVVENHGFNDKTWLDRAGNWHSDAMRVTERYTRMGPDHIQYEATIVDPNVFTRPWKISMPLYRRMEKNAQLTEFKCIEFAEELLYGDLQKKPAK